MSEDSVDASALECDGHALAADWTAPTRSFARLGHPLKGTSVRIGDPNRELGERSVGEILVRGAGVVESAFSEGATSPLTGPSGWLRTGDLGYLADGELVCCGRQKDIIVIAGRNLSPEPVEAEMAKVSGVRPGSVAVFGVRDASSGTERVVVMAERRRHASPSPRDIASAVRRSADVSPLDVVVLEPGTLPKTTSGKMRRFACRARYSGAETSGSLSSQKS